MSIFGNVRVARKKEIVESIVELWGAVWQTKYCSCFRS